MKSSAASPLAMRSIAPVSIRAVVRVRQRHERAGHQLLGGVSRQPAERRVDLHEAAQVGRLHGDEREPDRRLLEGDAEANLGLLELCPGALRLGAGGLCLAVQAGVLERRRRTIAELGEQLQLLLDERVVEADADDADRAPTDDQGNDRVTTRFHRRARDREPCQRSPDRRSRRHRW